MILRHYMIPVLLTCGLLFAGGCAQDYFDGPESPPAGSVKFTVAVPGGVSAPGTRGLPLNDERTIDQDNFRILLFNENPAGSGTWVCKRVIQPGPTDWGASTTVGGVMEQSFRIALLPEEKGIKFKAMLFANLLLAEFPASVEGKTMDWVRSNIRIELPDGSMWPTDGTRKLPLYGETIGTFDSNVFSVKTVSLIRPLARIDVGVNITSRAGDLYDLDNMAGSRPARGGDFYLSSVTVHAGSRSIQVAPDAAAYDPAAGKVTAPSLTGAVPYAVSPGFTPNPPNAKTYMLSREIYVPECSGKTDDNSQSVFLIVGGYYNGSSSVTYYRIDLYDPGADPAAATGPTAANRFDLLRNYAYVVDIRQVKGPGYPDPEQAAQAKPVNDMEVAIEAKDQADMVNITTDGQYRLALSASGTLRFDMPGQRRDLSVFTDYTGIPGSSASGWSLTWDDYNTKKDWLVFYDDSGNEIPESGWATQGVTHGAGGVTSTLHIGMKPYLKAGDRFVTLTFTSGRMSATVRLQQHVDGVPGDLGEWGDQNIPVDVVPVAFSMQPGRIVMDYGFYRFGAKVYMDSNYPIYFKGYIVNGELTTDGSNLPAWLPKQNITGLPNSHVKKTVYIKYEATAENEHPGVTLRFQSGNLIRDLQVIYDNGLIPFTTLATEGWTDYPIVNGLGMLFNRIGNKDIGSTPAAGDKSLPWSTDKQSVGGTATGFNTAQANMLAVTRFYISTSNKIPAFTECRTMGYGNVWLFSRDELQVLLKYNLMLGPSYRFAPQSELLSSSEVDQNNAYTVKYNGPGSVSSYSRDKNGSYIVRCVRAF